jgi:tetratricopeptide (TPR) repeat protein
MRAAGQLWLLDLKANNQEAANIRFQQLKAMQSGLSFGRLAMLIPVSDRQAILSRYGTPEEWLFFSSQSLANVEHVRDVQQLLSASESSRFNTSMQLIKAYHMDGRQEDASLLCEEVIQDHADFLVTQHGYAIMVIEQYGWLMRQQGPAGCRKALAALNAWVLNAQGQIREGRWHWLLVERARLHVALGEFDQAEEDLREFSARLKYTDDEYPLFLTAGLLQGFLLTEQGDPDAGRAAWRMTLTSQGYQSQTIAPTFAPLVSRSIMASLTEQVTDQEIDLVVNWLQSVVPRESPMYFILAVARVQGSAIKSQLRPLALHMWQSDSARELARGIALRSVPYREYLHHPIYLAGLQLLDHRVLGASASPQQRQLCLQLIENVHLVVSHERQMRDHLITIAQLVLTTPSLATWEVIGPQLSNHPEIQAGVAYLCGKRCQVLGRSDDAQAFFTIALESSTAESLVKEMTRTEIVE